MSVPERLDLLCRTDREVALRAAARYIDLLLHRHIQTASNGETVGKNQVNSLYDDGIVFNITVKVPIPVSYTHLTLPTILRV